MCQQNQHLTLYNMENKILPSNIDIERAILGAILLEKTALFAVKDKISSEMFYLEQHRLIFNACHAIYLAGKGIDLLTVSQSLSEAGNLDRVGGYLYLAELTSRVVSSAHIEYHAEILITIYLKRKIIFVSHEAQCMAFEDVIPLSDIYEKLQKAQAGYRDVIVRLSGFQSVSLFDAYLEQIKAMELQIKSGKPYGLVVGKDFIDKYLGTIEPGLIIIGGRPGMGKTTFGMWLSFVLAKNSYSGAFIGLELTHTQIMRRFMAMISGIRLDLIKQPQHLTTQDWNIINQADVPKGLFLPNMTYPYISHLCMEIEHLVKKGAQFVVIDQLNFIKPDPKKGSFSRNDILGDISRELSQLAKKLNIPLILLHQLNRQGVEEPELHHLRDSGNIEQDARVVIFVDVPAKRGVKQLEDGSSSQGIAVIKIAKNGEGEAPLKAYAEYIPHLFTYNDLNQFSNFKPSEKYSESLPF